MQSSPTAALMVLWTPSLNESNTCAFRKGLCDTKFHWKTEQPASWSCTFSLPFQPHSVETAEILFVVSCHWTRWVSQLWVNFKGYQTMQTRNRMLHFHRYSDCLSKKVEGQIWGGNFSRYDPSPVPKTFERTSTFTRSRRLLLHKNSRRKRKSSGERAGGRWRSDFVWRKSRRHFPLLWRHKRKDVDAWFENFENLPDPSCVRLVQATPAPNFFSKSFPLFSTSVCFGRFIYFIFYRIFSKCDTEGLTLTMGSFSCDLQFHVFQVSCEGIAVNSRLVAMGNGRVFTAHTALATSGTRSKNMIVFFFDGCCAPWSPFTRKALLLLQHATAHIHPLTRGGTWLTHFLGITHNLYTTVTSTISTTARKRAQGIPKVALEPSWRETLHTHTCFT